MMRPIDINLPDEASLLQQIEEGSKEAFNILYEKYWEKAYSEAYRSLKDHDQAKDIIQEIFTHLWLHRDTLHIDNLPAYLHIAIRNRVIKLAARQKHTHPFFKPLENMAEERSKADSDLLWREFFHSYEALLKTLPPKRQLIFRLRFQEDFSTRDIARQLGLSRKTVQNQLNKALEKLRISLSHLFILLIFLLSGTGS